MKKYKRLIHSLIQAEIMERNVDVKLCPFCGKDNHCQAKTGNPCWCFEIKVPGELLALLPEFLQGRACVCQSCVAEFLKDPQQFKAIYEKKLLKR